MHKTDPLRSLEQRRAEDAWEVAWKNRGSKEFLRVTQNAPAMIMSSGLMPTLAFFKSKGKEHEKVLQGLLGWLGDKLGCSSSKSFESIIKKLHQSESRTYMEATEEALEWLKWLRHFSKALYSETNDKSRG